jgi:hypothetical protein
MYFCKEPFGYLFSLTLVLAIRLDGDSGVVTSLGSDIERDASYSTGEGPVARATRRRSSHGTKVPVGRVEHFVRR